jgi:hypothetical protein
MDLRGIAFGLAVLALGSPGACDPGHGGDPPHGTCLRPSTADVSASPKGWRLVVRDDFSGTKLDPCWRAYRKYTGAGAPLSSLITVGTGYLSLYARGGDTGDIALTRPQRYGRYDVRACSHITRGSWSGIFLWPDGDVHSEIDIVEAANEQHSWFNLHWGANSQTNQQIPFPGPAHVPFNTAAPTGPAHCRQWHTWSFVWTATTMRLSMDGRTVVDKSDPAALAPFDQQMNLLVEMERGEAGNDWSNGAPAPNSVSALYVDWLRVYTPV